LLPHDGQHRLHGDQGRDKVELEDGAEVIGIDLFQRRVQPLTGDVAQDVDPSERLRGGAHGRVDLAGVGDVTADEHRFAQFVGEPANAILSTREKHHLCAGRRSGTCRCRSDPRRCSGNQHNGFVDVNRTCLLTDLGLRAGLRPLRPLENPSIR